MDLKKMVEIGGKIEIISKVTKSKNLRSFSMIQDISDEGDLVISLPMLEGRPILLNPGERVEIRLFKEEASYLFNGNVKNRYRINDAIFFSIIKTSPIKRIQRREYYRLKVVLPVTSRVLDDDIEKESQFIKGYSIDISGGGLKLSTDYYLELNTLVECHIDLDKGEELIIKGKVVRVNQANSPDHKYELGISFCCITRKVRDDLIRFIFSKQREIRKKGLI
ncbi:MAG: hypothetical protein GX340_07820 [Clostridiales bacterium]|nr:hypothetical protein [Clostridiales bacterium]